MRKVFWLFLLALPLVAAGSYFTSEHRNPYPEVDWIEEAPGAGDRYVTYTPVLRTNHKIVLGPTLGADYAELSFQDMDDDGTKEVIIETDNTFGSEEYSPERHVLKYRQGAKGRPEFVVISSKGL